jgi:hypothetical protein
VPTRTDCRRPDAVASRTGGLSDIASHARELISFGIAGTGSPLVNSQGLGDVHSRLVSLPSWMCFAKFAGLEPICEFVRNIGISDAERVFKTDSDQTSASTVARVHSGVRARYQVREQSFEYSVPPREGRSALEEVMAQLKAAAQ